MASLDVDGDGANRSRIIDDRAALGDHGEHAIVPLEPAPLAERPEVVIERRLHRVLVGYEEAPQSEWREVEWGGGTALVHTRPVYREVVETDIPFLRSKGFTAKVCNGDFSVNLANGVRIVWFWNSRKLMVWIPCRACARAVLREEMPGHSKLPHCPLSRSCSTPLPVRPLHLVSHLMDLFAMRRTAVVWDEIATLVEAGRQDLALRMVFARARKQGRVLAVNKIPDAPCALCGLPIQLDDIIEMVPRAAADLLRKRPRNHWAHFSCVASPSPDRVNPRAALATYYPRRDERKREA